MQTRTDDAPAALKDQFGDIPDNQKQQKNDQNDIDIDQAKNEHIAGKRESRFQAVETALQQRKNGNHSDRNDHDQAFSLPTSGLAVIYAWTGWQHVLMCSLKLGCRQILIRHILSMPVRFKIPERNEKEHVFHVQRQAYLFQFGLHFQIVRLILLQSIDLVNNNPV